jgi:hypothetical protein
MHIMPNAKSSWLNWSAVGITLLTVFAVSVPMQGQTGTAVKVGKGMPEDWTHHHLIFSNPGTEQNAIQNGRHDEWQRIVNDPRYVMQQMRRNASTGSPIAAGPVSLKSPFVTADSNPIIQAPNFRDSRGPVRSPGTHIEPVDTGKIHSDWSMELAPFGKVGADQFPAKYSFDTTAAGNCAGAATPDYVVYNTGQAGSNTGDLQANIIAYDNIYSGCTGTVPTVYWSYYTGTGTSSTSPVLSLDGTKVAFIESGNPTGSSTLQILKWAPGQGTDISSPVAPTNLYTNTTAGAGGNTPWSTCPANQSCLISVAFQAQPNTDTASAPYYDYGSDTLWVGDSGGYVHEFTGVFLGTPAEVTTNWPALISTIDIGECGPITSPVYDSVHATIFVADFCGDLDQITTAGVVTSSGEIGFGDPDMDEGPLVDPAAGEVYAFVVADATTTSNGVFQFPYNFASGSTGTEATVGTGSLSANPLYAGTFDNEYFTSTNSASPSGNLWVCANTAGNPELFAIPITNNVMGTAVNAATVSGAAATCSPVTEFCTNGGAACTATAGTDYLFVSPQTEPATGEVTGCTPSEGCVITYTASGTTATLEGAGAFAGGASGMIVDTQNTTTSGTLQLYFGTLDDTGTCTGNGTVGSGTGGCAIQAPLTTP